MQLRDEDGSVITGHNMIGDLYIQGPSSALLYWNNRAKSRDTFQGAWTKSGDKYTRDPDGYYTYAGRNDDMLKVSGIYVSPFEVEATLVQHPAVLEAAVIGKEDSDGLTKAGKAGKVVAIGFDGNADLQGFVKDGTIEAIAVQSAYEMGNLGVKTVMELVEGKKVPAFRDTGVLMVNKKNIDSPAAKNVLY